MSLFKKASRQKARARICLQGVSGGGKAQPVDTLIPTPNGMRRIGDLKIGEYVFDRNGNPTKVLDIFPQGEKEVFSVKLSDGRTTLCNDEHLWSFYTSKGNLKTITLREMIDTGIKTDNKGYRFHIPTSKAVEYEEKDFDIDPYVLGSLIGNGCCTEKALTLSSNDIEQVEIVARLLNTTPIRQSEKNYSWKFERYDGKIGMNGKELRFLQSDEVLGYLLNKKSNEKYIDEDYKFSSIEQRYSLLQGLFDTDGSIESKAPRFTTSYSTSSLTLAKDIQEILFSLGYSSSLSEDDRDGRNINYSVNVLIDNKEKEKLFRLTRKKDRAIKAKEYNSHRDYNMISIVEAKDLGYKTDMVCIYVENEEHLYLTNDYIVTHNTLSALLLAHGIQPNWEKIAILDSERGRALFYANRSDFGKDGIGEFLHAPLDPPYTADRYIEYMREAEQIVGEDGVLIIDSASHAWMGEGGVLQAKEQIATQRGKNDFSAWGDAGKIQNRFVDTIMDLKCHVIITLRSKTEYAQEKDVETGKTSIKKVGLKPVQRDDLEYEFTIVFDVDKETHYARIIKDNTFLDAEGWCGVIDEELGERLRAWLEDGIEPEVYHCEECKCRIKATQGRNGTVLPKDIIAKSQELFGKQLCGNCTVNKVREQKEQEQQ